MNKTNRIEQLLKYSPAVLYICKATGDYGATFISESITRQFGYTPEDFTGDSAFWASRIHPDDVARVFEELKHLFSGGYHTHEYRFLHKDGTYKWVRDELTLIRDSKGEPMEIAGSWIDISDRKEAEEELGDAYRVLEFKVEARTKDVQEKAAVLNAMGDGLILFDMEGRLVDINPALEKLTGIPREKQVGKLVHELMPTLFKEEELPKVTRIMRGLMKGEIPETNTLTLKRKDGKWIPIYFNLSFLTNAEGTPYRIIATVRDISTLKQAEEERERLFNLDLDMLCIAGTDGYFKRLNPTWEKILGFSSEELMAKPFLDFIHPDDVEQSLNVFKQMSDKNPVINFANRYRCKNGSFRWLDWAAKQYGDKIYAAAHDITELKESMEIQSRLVSIIEASSDFISTADLDGNITYLNKAGKRMLGLSETKEISNFTIENCIPDEVKDKVFSEVVPAIMQNGSYSGEVLLKELKGRKIPVAISCALLKNQKNEPELMSMIAKDITERQQAEDSLMSSQQKLKESEEKFRLAFDNAAIGKAMANGEGRFIKVNPAMCRMLGYEEQELLEKTWMDITHPDFLDIASQISDKLIKVDSPSIYFDCKFLCKNGTTIWINLNVVLVRDVGGKPLLFIADMVNISELKRFAEELDYRNQIIRKFLTVKDEEIFHDVLKIVLDAMGSPYGVFGFIDQDGSLVVPSMTRHIWKKCNVPEKEIVFPRDTWGESAWPTAIREKKSNFSNEASTITPKGHIKVTRHVTVPIKHRSNVIGLVQVANKELDYTIEDVKLLEIISTTIAPILAARLERDDEEKRRTLAENSLEEKVVELERSNKELEQFAYVASHDLQEPLRMVSSYTQLLEKRYKEKLDEDARDFINFAVDGATRMQRLINDLLDYSRVTTKGNPFKKIDLSSIIGQVIVNLQQKINETQALIVNEELPFVKGDESQLIRLFQNLIDNAIKFRGEGSPRITIKATTENKTVTLSVQDNGIGIDEIYADRIFTIFQRLHNKNDYPGTGIGLAICRRIVERHGGTIWFESEVGKESTFWFTLKQ